MGICEMPTGIGKTRTIKETLLRTQRPTLIITPSSNLRTQTYEYLAASFGTDDVGLLNLKTA
jgi:superfamily II DNA or RNA helicase